MSTITFGAICFANWSLGEMTLDILHVDAYVGGNYTIH